MSAIAQTTEVTGRHLRFFLRQPWFIGIYLTQPLIWLFLFSQLFKSVTAIPGFAGAGNYIDYLTPGVVVMTALFSCGWSGMTIVEDINRSIIDRLLVTPMHRSAIIAGLNIYELVSLAIQVAIIGGLAMVLGATFPGGIVGFAVLTACAMLVGATVAAFSDAVALMQPQRETVIGISTLLTLPLTFLSASFMPLNLVPEWLRTIATYNPVNWAVEAGRSALVSTNPDWPFIVARLAALAALALVTTAWATWTFRTYQRSI